MNNKGFSLIEVCLALLVVAFCLVVILGFFPSGLRDVEDAISETRTTQFAEYKFAEYRANALVMMTTKAAWDSAATIGSIMGGDPANVVITTTNYCGEPLRYRIRRSLRSTGRISIWQITLEVQNSAAGNFDWPMPNKFYLEIPYNVMGSQRWP